MAKLKANRVKKIICPTCKVMVLSKLHPTITMKWFISVGIVTREGEFYETIEDNNLIDDGPNSNKLH